MNDTNAMISKSFHDESCSPRVTQRSIAIDKKHAKHEKAKQSLLPMSSFLLDYDKSFASDQLFSNTKAKTTGKQTRDIRTYSMPKRRIVLKIKGAKNYKDEYKSTNEKLSKNDEDNPESQEKPVPIKSKIDSIKKYVFTDQNTVGLFKIPTVSIPIKSFKAYLGKPQNSYGSLSFASPSPIDNDNHYNDNFILNKPKENTEPTILSNLLSRYHIRAKLNFNTTDDKNKLKIHNILPLLPPKQSILPQIKFKKTRNQSSCGIYYDNGRFQRADIEKHTLVQHEISKAFNNKYNELLLRQMPAIGKVGSKFTLNKFRQFRKYELKNIQNQL